MAKARRDYVTEFGVILNLTADEAQNLLTLVAYRPKDEAECEGVHAALHDLGIKINNQYWKKLLKGD